MTTLELKELSEAVTPFLQTICWPLLFLIFILFLRNPIGKLIDNIGEFSFKAGASGVEASAKLRQSEIAANLGAAVASKLGDDSETRLNETHGIAKTVESVTRQDVDLLIGRKILWVDDRPQNNVYERNAIEALGLSVTISTFTEDALNKLATGTYDLIISDMGRPPDPKAGYTLLNKIRQAGNKIPFIIYAGSNLHEHKMEALSRGGQGSTNNPQELLELVVNSLLTSTYEAVRR